MRTSMIGSTLLFLAASIAIGQETLPNAVTRSISEDTVAVVHLDLKSLDVGFVGNVLRDWPDPQNILSRRTISLEKALRKLKSLPVNDVYLTLDTSGLPLDGLLIVPATDTKKVSEILKEVWPNDVDETEGAVIAGAAGARNSFAASKGSGRSEFQDALLAVKGSAIKVAFSPSQDARRVLREFLPVLPAELGGGLTEPLSTGTKWIGVGLNHPPKLEIQLIARMTNASTAQSLQQTIAVTLTAISKVEQVKQLFPKADELRAIVTPMAEGDRVILSLTEKNDGAKRLLDEVGKPLLELALASARRSRTVGNLKNLALAMHNYHDANKSFPPAASSSKDGKRLLSWRVLILKYLDPDLYSQFHLEEPWDSAHNKTLIEKMPDVFYSSNISTEQRQQGLTTYLVPVGEKTPFEKSSGVTIRDITDGTSNTIMIVEAMSELAVTWTKPDDLTFDPDKPWNGLAVPPKGTFWASFCDGSVRRLGPLNEKNLRRYLQMNDGEIIDE